MDWKPDLATLKSWGTAEHWQQPYFEWLQTQKPLPSLPEGGRDAQHAMFRPLWDILRIVLNAHEKTIELFHAGGFKMIHQLEFHDPDNPWVKMAQEREQAHAKYRAIVEEMLRYTGEVDDAFVERYVERLDEARPYSGPMG